MSLDAGRLQQIFDAEAVSTWQPPTPALRDFLPGETPVVSPARIEAVQEVLHFASREKLRVLPAGSTEHLHLGAPPGAVDLVLSSRRMNRVLEYEPADLTLVVEAGATLHAIKARALEFGQRLGPSPWPGRAATIGGACAANRFGLTRLRDGTLRDAVLGARVVHADGSTTRTGGKVVKNVTGYDLGKLYVGSRGSLAFIAAVNLRLVARAADVGFVVATLAPHAARQRLLEMQRGWLRPTAVLVLHGRAIDGAAERLAEASAGAADVLAIARFEGPRGVVQEQVQECAQRLDGSELTAASGTSIWEDAERLLEPDPDICLLRVSSLPVAVLDTLANVREVFGTSAVAIGLFGVGASFVRLTTVEPEAVSAFYARMSALGASVALEYAPMAWTLRIQPMQPPAARLQAAIKSVYDPAALLRPAFATEITGRPHGDTVVRE
jgi:glycolate oxidase FAD binding subunit